MRALTIFLSLLCLLALPTTAAAQASPRAARAMYLIDASRPAVMVAPDRAWLPSDAPSAPLSICNADRCRPVRTVESCQAPACPGYGSLVITEGRVADVSDYPTDYAGFERERAALYADPVLVQLQGYFSGHPNPPSSSGGSSSGDLEWNPREEWRWELATWLGAGFLPDEDLGAIQWDFGGGFRFMTGDDEDWAGFVVPSSLGIDVRIHTISSDLDRENWDNSFAFGIQPHMSFVIDDTIRLPGFLGLVIPEVGGIARDGRPLAYYLSWSLPVDVLVAEHLAVSMRGSIMFIDEWIDGEAMAAIASLSVGLVFR